jgi:hypothetical protein
MLVRRDLGTEGGDYVRAYLVANRACGKMLGDLLLRRDIGSGSAWALVPSDVELKLPYAFEAGGVSPRRDPTWAEAVRSWFRQLQASTGVLAVIVEDGLAVSSDAFLSDLKEPIVFCGDSLFWTGVDPASVTGASWNPDIGIAVLQSEVPDPRTTLDTSLIARFAARAPAILIGAWDSEAHIVWQPG